MSLVRPDPTGASHEIDVDGLFFSTTDRRGVIDQANSVFVRNSRYRWDQLIGAPHNIIRHPCMPGGAFLALWDMLLKGQPSCAYVDNLAADGSRYTVFATITPLGDGFLSVRARPCATGLHDAANSLYSVVRPMELERRAEGASAHKTAVFGAGELTKLLQGAGFPDYAAFVQTALPAEVEARAELSRGLPRRPRAVGPYADILSGVHAMSHQIDSLLGRMGDLQDAATRIHQASEHASEAIAAREDAGRAMLTIAAANSAFAPVLMPINLWVSMGDEMARALSELSEAMSALETSCGATRFRLALAKLHADMLGQFAAELIDQVPGYEHARGAMVDLCAAIVEGMEETRDQMDANERLAKEAGDKIAEATGLLRLPLDLIGAWRETVEGRDDPQVRELIPLVDEQAEQSRLTIDTLADLSSRCAKIAEPMETAAIFEQLSMIQQAAYPRPARARD